MKEHLNNPVEIEKRSFEIIEEELDKDFDDERLKDLTLRVIHTTADFEYASLLEVKNQAIDKALSLLSQGNTIYADTSMLKTGVNNRALENTNNRIINYVHDEEVRKRAHENGTTRSIEAIEKAIKENIKIYAIGNAPTALYQLIEATKQGRIKPDLIIATPIGFVGAADSKRALDDLDCLGIPYIRINGRKGGSAVAAAILNSLLYRIRREW